MRIQLVAVGTRLPAWQDDGVLEYARRLPRECSLELVEIPLPKRTKGGDVARQVRTEGRKLLAAVPAGTHIVALDARGESWRTATLARHLEEWLAHERGVALLVGGPDGLSGECLREASTQWSLGPLTLPHGLVRVVVAEQLYRAWSMLHNHPYHRR